jgi:hypothetical protein
MFSTIATHTRAKALKRIYTINSKASHHNSKANIHFVLLLYAPQLLKNEALTF